MRKVIKNKKMTILLIVSILLLTAIIAISASYAAWIENSGESKYLQFGIDDENPSVKYQIYVPIDAEGNKIDGVHDIINRKYTLDREEDIYLIDGYALVGWDGGINLARLEIPSVYTMQINQTPITKPPRTVFVHQEYSEYVFAGNTVIAEIEIPSNIIAIDSGAFMSMSSLTKVQFKGVGEIRISDYAFADNHNLSIIEYGNREVDGDLNKINYKG